MKSGLAALVPVKSASAPENAAGIPIAASVLVRSKPDVYSNRGKVTFTFVCRSAVSQASKAAGVRLASSAGSPSSALGSTTTIDIAPPL